MFLLHPEVAFRECSDCQKWLYEDGPQGMARKPNEHPPRSGKPLPRLIGLPQFAPRCDICPKIPTGEEPKPGNAVKLSGKNQRAYRHYLECKEIGTFGEWAGDAIVRRNAAMIGKIVKEADDVKSLHATVLAMNSVFKKQR